MTREEAISCIKQIRFRGYLRGANPFYEQDTEALEMAIQALSQEPCDDAISREAAINIASLHCLTIDETVKALEQLPSVTRQTGEWERHYIRPNVYKDLLWYCSSCGKGCGYNNAFMFDFCPNCGAKMESDDKE